jgi:type III secretion protein U
MAGETEEKNLPASQRKLRKAREKGQTASSTDFVNSLALAAGIIVLMISWPRYLDVFTGSMRLALDNAVRPSQGDGIKAVLSVFVLIGEVVTPLLVAVAATGFLGHIIHKKGLILSLDPIKPDFNKLNPAQGFTRIFSVKNGAEFLIALARCLFWFVVSGLIVWYAMPQVIMSSSCDLPCVSTVAVDLIKRLVIVAIIMVIVLGLLDLPFQIFMFMREQKMSRTEMKHEMKEQEGSPEFAGHRRDQHRQMASGGRMGVKGAAIVIVSSGEAIAIAYDAETQPVPIIVAKGKGVHADPILKAAELMGTPIEIDPRLAAELSKIGVGNMVPEREFNPVAMALVRHGKAG